MNKVLNEKIFQHNQKVKEFCLKGDKCLISGYGEPMSLQKIQVELEVIRSMASEEGQELNKKVWDGFKNWRKEPKVEKVKKPKAVKKLDTLDHQEKPEPAKD
jgi:hypothetical protein